MPRAAPSISEAAVLRATGHGWDHWSAILDRFGPAQGHTAMARHLREAHGLSPWWSQEVTIQFERARGLRKPLERPDGRFEVTVSRTLPIAQRAAWDAWTDACTIGTWRTAKVTQDVRVGGTYRNADGDRGTFLAVDAPRRLRFTWDNPAHAPGSVVEVRFDARDARTTVVRVTHGRMRTQKDADATKVVWGWALTSLACWIATGKGLPFAAWDAARKADAKARAASRREVPRQRLVGAAPGRRARGDARRAIGRRAARGA